MELAQIMQLGPLSDVATNVLVDVYNSLNPDSPIKKFRDRQTAIDRCTMAVAEAREKAQQNIVSHTKAASEKPESGTPEPRKPGVTERLRQFFADGGSGTFDEVMAAVDCKNRNTMNDSLVCLRHKEWSGKKGPLKWVRTGKIYHFHPLPAANAEAA